MFDTAHVPDSGVVSIDPLKIYTGILGQIGDIVLFTPTVRRIKQLFPNSQITWAVSSRYREAGELVGGLTYVDRVFVTELYFEKLAGAAYMPWHLGWPVDLRGDDEVEEQRRHDIVLETRPFPRRRDFWNYGHAVDAYAYCAGVPGPIERRTEVCIPHGTIVPPDARGRIVFHNDPLISEAKAWPWRHAGEFIRGIAPEPVVLLGGPGEPVRGALDYRGLTTLVQAAAIIAAAKCYVGVESGLLHIAGALQVPMVGLFGTSYVPAYSALYPDNPHGIWLQAEGALEGIRPEMVLQAVAQILVSPPQSRRPHVCGPPSRSRTHRT